MNENEKNTDQIIPEEIPVEPEVEETVFEESVPVTDTPQKKGKVDGKLILGICGAVALVAIVALILTLSLSSPLRLVGTGMKNSIQALEQNELVTLVDDVNKGGSIEALVDVKDVMQSFIGFGFGEGQLSLKVYTDADDSAAAAVVSLKNGEEILADASLVANEDAIAIQSEALLGETAYGIDLEKAMDTFEDSAFGPGGAYDLGIEINDTMKEMRANEEKLAKDFEKAVKSVMPVFLKSFKKHADIHKDGSSVLFGDKEVKTTAVSIELDSQQLTEVVIDMLAYFREDKTVRQFLEDNMAYLLTLSGELNVTEADVQDYIDTFYKQLDEITEEDVRKDLEDVSVKMVFHITKSGKQLIGMETTAEAEGSKAEGFVYAGPDLKDITQIRFSFDDGYEAYSGSYTVATDSDKAFEAELEITNSRDEIYTVTVTHDKKDGEFEIGLTDPWGYGYGVTGTLEKTGDQINVYLGSASFADEKIDLNVDVVVKASDRMPSVPQYTDILEMDSTEIENVIADIEDAAMGLLTIFY